MSSLRDEIRSILREELAALRAELPVMRAAERVQINGSADLESFARDLVMRALNDPDFASAVASGAQRFELSSMPPANYSYNAAHIVTSPQNPARGKASELSKTLVTERDIAALASDARVLRVPKQCRLTPLANDEARRRGIRIERFAS